MKILVLGIGNVLIADEGAGVYFSSWFNKNLKNKNQNIDFLDGGTMAMHLAHIIAKYDKVYVVDCINADDLKIGDVVFFDYKAIPNNVNYQGSAHELEMMMTLNFMDMLGDLPQCFILGIVPTRLMPMEFSLSADVKKAFYLMKDTLLKALKQDYKDLEFEEKVSIDEVILEYKNLGR
ncbi:hydrogenase maturation protease [Campylobacter canadensis]|uniref:Hydrogenase maturation protease n=1 Tax=Campylobacter canadensis TaxID=449520 RepID=A0ABS7WQ20_9BACT|nr:hydrogenase maturation protease [Campylobacter canadensis]MBZ7986868.1 hydrogenase maturation protease [Campylobacter canadensis]MBZ7994189.1 hydrogenase maturation protease [Campylobacter canadensis]MBZ7995818.1 hydrogenase maturation protease [Campylobacter canadensis]MBZ7997905.1 hydrogenase maturation protease [Campylobacter canadensis]MBZ7999521.1 hydrogenase maturation protease [Campylobacter canadensis]